MLFHPLLGGQKMLPLSSNMSKKLLGKGGLLLGCPLPDTLTLPGIFFLPRIRRGQQLRRNQTHVQTHILWLELPFTPRLGIATVQPPAQQTSGKASCAGSSQLLSLPFALRHGQAK